MPTATPAGVRERIGTGTPDPVYLLQGDDDVEKAALAHEFEALVEEELRAFNVERIHAGDATTGDRLEATVGQVVASARSALQELLSQRERVHDELQSGVRRCRTAGRGGELLSAEQLRECLERDPEQRSAAAHLRRLGVFLQQLDRVEMDEQERTQAQASVLSSLVPDEMRIDEFARAARLALYGS